MKVALIGYTGSVGKEIYDLLDKEKNKIYTFNRENILTILNEEYDTVICSAPTSQKLKVNLDLIDYESDLNNLCEMIKQVKTKNFILVSSQSILFEKNKYSDLQNKVLKTVSEFQPNNTIYLMDTLYGENLKKGFIYDVLNKEWTIIKKEVLYKYPELNNCYKPIENSDFYQQIKSLPDDLLNKLGYIENIYPNDKIFQTTYIYYLALNVVSNLDKSSGLISKIKEIESFKGSEIKNIYYNSNNTILSKYFSNSKQKFKKRSHEKNIL